MKPICGTWTNGRGEKSSGAILAFIGHDGVTHGKSAAAIFMTESGVVVEAPLHAVKVNFPLEIMSGEGA